jgi:hypothetical protein
MLAFHACARGVEQRNTASEPREPVVVPLEDPTVPYSLVPVSGKEESSDGHLDRPIGSDLDSVRDASRDHLAGTETRAQKVEAMREPVVVPLDDPTVPESLVPVPHDALRTLIARYTVTRGKDGTVEVLCVNCEHRWGATLTHGADCPIADLEKLTGGEAIPSPPDLDELIAALRLAYKVFPRPWIDGGVTWDQWAAAAAAIEAALVKAESLAVPSPPPPQEIDMISVNLKEHASAPIGMRCSDCQMDGEACPRCYKAWWQRRHPNTRQLPHEVEIPDIFKGDSAIEALAWDRGWREASRQSRESGSAAAIPSPPPDRWQKIETAPKDGHAYLMMIGGRVPFVAWWVTGDEAGGWWRGDAGYRIYPTHWMPLPDPPGVAVPARPLKENV